MEWNYNDKKDGVVLPNGKPNRLKKITGTRFAAILGLNPWNSSFQAWCEITGVAKLPFQDNEYTIAGKTIEPKIIEYCKDYFNPDDPTRVQSPEEYFGATYNKVKYDFFAHTKRFGGMWDAIILRADKKTPRALIEIKTTKRVEDWMEQPPVYYLLQLMLYAHLQNVNTVFLTASFLESMDYQKPELFVPTKENTIIMPYNVSDFRLEIDGIPYSIVELVELASDWWDKHIETGISPQFDEVRDAEILKVLRTNKPQNDLNLDEMIRAANELESKISEIKTLNLIDQMEKKLKTLKDGIKVGLMDSMTENDTVATYQSYKLTKGETKKIDTDKLKLDGLYDKYITIEPKYTLLKIKDKDIKGE